MTEEIKAKAKELIEWANEQLGDKKFFLRLAKGKVVAIIFADPNSSDYEEFIKQRLSQPHETKESLIEYAKILNECGGKLNIALNKGLRGESIGVEEISSIANASFQLDRIQELQDRIELERQLDPDPPLGQVFAILTGVIQYCDRYYDNPDKLQTLLRFVAREFKEDARS